MAVRTMPDSLKVLFLESSKNLGGQERRILHEMRLLCEAGHLPLLACPPDAALYERADKAGLEVFGVPMRNAVQPSALFSLFSVIRHRRVDIIYAHSGKDSTLGGIAGLLTGVPLVRSRELLNPIKRASSYNLLTKRVLACSGAVRDHLIGNMVDKGKVFVQYPPVAVGRFCSVVEAERQAVMEELGLEGCFPVITCVAAFRTEKRHEDLIRALPEVRDVFPGALVIMPGSGSYVAELERIAQEAGVSGAVRFLGEREDIPAILKNTDVFVLPSLIEPFGMAPVEAMAAGVPVVVTKTGGLAEIVTDGVDGLHVPVGEPEAVAAAVVRICREPGLRDRLIAAGRQRAFNFDEAHALESLLGHFREVLTL